MTFPALFSINAGKGLHDVKIDFASTKEILAAEKWKVSDEIENAAWRQRAEYSVEFAALAAKRWRTYARDEAWAGTLRDFQEKIEIDAEGEYCFFLALTSARAKDDLLGAIMVRRTWCHHLFVDFLYIHPSIAGKERPMSGIGTALLFSVCALARDLKVRLVWAEATKGSCGWYEGLLGKKVTDHFFIKSRQIRIFAEELEALCT